MQRINTDFSLIGDRTALGAHHLHGFPRREQQPSHVQIEVFLDVLQRDGLNRCKLVIPHVVHEDIDLTEYFPRFREQPLNVLQLRDVCIEVLFS